MREMILRDAVQHLAATGGDLTHVRAQLDRLLRTAVGYDFAALSTLDPATNLWTSCFVSGLPLDGGRSREDVIFAIEFAGGDPNSYAELAAAPTPVGRLHAATGGDITRARRYGELLGDLRVGDELRAVLRAGNGGCWGTLTLYRLVGAPVFDDRDEAAIGEAVPAMADLFRLTLLRAALGAAGGVDDPPGVVLVAVDGTVSTVSETAACWLDRLDDRGRLPSAARSVVAAVAGGDGLARAALPTRDGGWVVLHGSAAGADGIVAVIVEGARSTVLAEVIAGAYGFTPREREVTALAAKGGSTKQIARELGISPFTVQDHLKAVFAKTGVQTRGELVAALFATHYRPRRDAGSTPSPYGWYLDDAVA